MVRALPLTSSWMLVLRTPRARARRGEAWPMTCRARSRRRAPPASRRPSGVLWRGTGRRVRLDDPGADVSGKGRWLAFMSVDLGLVVGLAVGCVAGGVQGPGDLGVGQAGLAGGVGELAEIGGGVG